MTNFVRLAALAAAATIAATPAMAAPLPATPVAKARVNIVKPLTLAATRDLHFGTIVVTGNDSVSINQAGTVTCGAAANVTCDTTGAQSAQFHVTGANNQLVRITATASSLVNGAASLAFTPSAPANVTLPNSGAAGTDFNVGGTVAVLASSPEGLYVGDINVTVEY
ncbi:DUF4402 domain-containing protein [Sphingomonas sp. RB56-2]|uniref:DUF4402 domain-containing protein n=1 Tax=Sphingomonas brevis TaxID=2908206 RepID=A0ABT0SB98_9SPHN|nr:DUF4402 domain-containing protein [Sphingomonas brevis]MCL6741623.1 DUF4402 domain-containing protein [Sphingomonas brevis]